MKAHEIDTLDLSASGIFILEGFTEHTSRCVRVCAISSFHCDGAKRDVLIIVLQQTHVAEYTTTGPYQTSSATCRLPTITRFAIPPRQRMVTPCLPRTRSENVLEEKNTHQKPVVIHMLENWEDYYHGTGWMFAWETGKRRERRWGLIIPSSLDWWDNWTLDKHHTTYETYNDGQ